MQLVLTFTIKQRYGQPMNIRLKLSKTTLQAKLSKMAHNENI